MCNMTITELTAVVCACMFACVCVCVRACACVCPVLTLLSVWDCPTSIKMLEARMERQKLTKMIDLSERIYLRDKEKDMQKE